MASSAPLPPSKPPVAKLSDIFIDIINESTVVTDAEVQKIVAALQKQVTNDFAPIYGINATLFFVAKNGPANAATHWQLGIFDDSGQAGALGYHDITAAGMPLGKVFAKTDLQNGSSVSVTISHELLEMLGDPDVNLTVFIQSTDTEGIIYAMETCDACEDDSFGYLIDGVLVSDFVYPSWFESFRTSGPFDKQGKITHPFELLSGGYIGIYRVPNSGGWTQEQARLSLHTGTDAISKKQYLNRARVGSRREKRRTPRDQWVRSVK